MMHSPTFPLTVTFPATVWARLSPQGRAGWLDEIQTELDARLGGGSARFGRPYPSHTEVERTESGHTNEETRRLILWLLNDEGLYLHYRALLGALDDGEAGEDAVLDELEDDVRRSLTYELWVEEVGASHPWPYAKQAAEVGSLWRVNWREVLDALRDEG